MSNDKRRALIIDFEATGVNDDAQATQIGYAEVGFEDGVISTKDAIISDGEVRGHFKYCKPDVPISLGSMAVTGICPEDVANEPSHKQVVPTVLDNTVGYVIGHNVDYDVKVAKNAGVDVSKLKAIDTLAIARNIYPELDSHSLSALLYRFYYSLARRTFGKAHDAGYDVAFCFLILDKICTDRDITNMEQLYELSEMCRIPVNMPFGKHRGVLISELPKDYVDWLVKKADIDQYLREALRLNHGV